LAGNAPEYYERPAVLIFKAPSAADEVIREILLGLEEEGIPAKVSEKRIGLAGNLAKAAADGSALNVGIGASAAEVVVHHRDLPLHRPLFLLPAEKYSRTNLRCLGANAARLVKGNPLLINDDLLQTEALNLP
jgi:hypothetical protein